MKERFKFYFPGAFLTEGLLQRRVQAPAIVNLTSIQKKDVYCWHLRRIIKIRTIKCTEVNGVWLLLFVQNKLWKDIIELKFIIGW